MVKHIQDANWCSNVGQPDEEGLLGKRASSQPQTGFDALGVIDDREPWVSRVFHECESVVRTAG